MSEVRLVVREADRDWSGTIHGSRADAAIAAQADPATLDELEAAVARFEKPSPNSRFFSNLSRGLRDEPYDAGLVIIDLEARLIVVESTYSSPGLEGGIWYHNGECATDRYLPYHLADDWLVLGDTEAWMSGADRRRRERAAKPSPDVREVFYGRSLLEFIVRETFAAFARRDEIAAAMHAEWAENAASDWRKGRHTPEHVDATLLTEDEVTPTTRPGQEHYASLFHNTLKQIHAAWLLTPREDLGGASPRRGRTGPPA